MRQKLTKMTLIVAGIFIVMTAVFGFYFYEHQTDAQDLMALYMPAVESITTEQGALSLLPLLRSNLFACALCVGLGLIPALFLPVWALLSNAMMIGALLGLVGVSGIMSPLKTVLFGLLPHGIFELPAFFLSMAMGIYLCRTLSLKLLGKAKEEKLLPMLNGIAKGFVLVVMPLLLVAAVIECYVTPYLMQFAQI